jgi:serine/threonine protein kinase
MHEHGIMHRDLKPENILLRNKDIIESNICIADFGLSSFVNVEKFMFSRCGTPGFVAPEIFNYESGNKKYGEICDEFSIGVIFHIM